MTSLAAILEPEGVATFEFPRLLNLIRLNEFDTIYHEHFSCLSLLAAERVFLANGLRIFDVEQLSTHGGSLRLFACRTAAVHERSCGVDELSALERKAGLHTDAPTSASPNRYERPSDRFSSC